MKMISKLMALTLAAVTASAKLSNQLASAQDRLPGATTSEYALQFTGGSINGSGHYVNVPDSPDLNPSQITVEFWAKRYSDWAKTVAYWGSIRTI